MRLYVIVKVLFYLRLLCGQLAHGLKRVKKGKNYVVQKFKNGHCGGKKI